MDIHRFFPDIEREQGIVDAVGGKKNAGSFFREGTENPSILTAEGKNIAVFIPLLLSNPLI